MHGGNETNFVAPSIKHLVLNTMDALHDEGDVSRDGTVTRIICFNMYQYFILLDMSDVSTMSHPHAVEEGIQHLVYNTPLPPVKYKIKFTHVNRDTRTRPLAI
jgi:hypothetical protein